MNSSASLGGVAGARGTVGVPESADFHRLGLAGCIDRLTAPLRRQGTCVHWETPHHGLEISASCASLLYRSAQEALNNAFRHAHATDVTVRLTAVFHGIRLTVADNGNGFGQRAAGSTSSGNAFPQASTADGGHSGLRTMSAEVQEAGGTVAISSEPGAGTEVTVTIPLD
ncbi:MAG: two-component system, NarL family, sensor histidine kinase UhpB [Arthrobacter pascens]|nr:two-component system, NarL family, sensor histidine kinase UhpB [Arthrobacter pascens]